MNCNSKWDLFDLLQHVSAFSREVVTVFAQRQGVSVIVIQTLRCSDVVSVPSTAMDSIQEMVVMVNMNTVKILWEQCVDIVQKLYSIIFCFIYSKIVNV